MHPRFGFLSRLLLGFGAFFRGAAQRLRGFRARLCRVARVNLGREFRFDKRARASTSLSCADMGASKFAMFKP